MSKAKRTRRRSLFGELISGVSAMREHRERRPVNGRRSRVPLPPNTDIENLVVTTHPTFQAIMQRSETRYRTEGGRTQLTS